MASKPYNGHPSYAAWNVALWVANDESNYRLALTCKRIGRTADRAAELFIERIGGGSTPDGVKWTKTNVRRAIGGL